MATEEKNESSEEWAEIDITPSEDKEADVAFEVEETSEDETQQVAAEETQEEPVVEEKAEEIKTDLPELDGISTKGAEKRIRQLVRQRKEREEELIRAQEEIKSLKEDAKYKSYSQMSTEEEAVTSTENFLTNQLALAEQNFKSAYESGDQEKLLEAQKALTNTQTELRFLEDRKKDVETRKAVLAYEAEEEPKQQERKAPPPNVKAKNWAARNEWFGQDKVATAAALAIDAELKEQGYDPSSDDFFEMIDQRIRQELPNKFKEAAEESEEATPTKPRQTVAGQSRSSASAKKVKLNKEDVRLAKKWGIPLEKYAVNKAQMEKANGDYTTIT